MDYDADSKLLWQRRLNDLRAWKHTHGNCTVPKAEGKLGRWVVRQRELHKKGKLEPERRQQLDQLGFVWNTNEAAWDHRFELLAKYAKQNGHCCVPISDPELGMWVAKMRANHRRGKLPLHRVKKLESIAFVWNTAEADWMDKYQRLVAFRDREGHSCVPFNEGELGWWVNTQRQSKRKGKLSAKREHLLNQASFVWNPQEFLASRRRQAAVADATAAFAAAPNHLNYNSHVQYRPSTNSPSPSAARTPQTMSGVERLHGLLPRALESRTPSPDETTVRTPALTPITCFTGGSTPLSVPSPGHKRKSPCPVDKRSSFKKHKPLPPPLHSTNSPLTLPPLGTDSTGTNTTRLSKLTDDGLSTELRAPRPLSRTMGDDSIRPRGSDVHSVASLLSPSPPPLAVDKGFAMPVVAHQPEPLVMNTSTAMSTLATPPLSTPRRPDFSGPLRLSPVPAERSRDSPGVLPSFFGGHSRLAAITARHVARRDFVLPHISALKAVSQTPPVN